jgi:hypothetical protein
MKQALFLSVLGLMLLVWGCQKELNFDDTTITGRNCTGCDYFPVCDSSLNKYLDSTEIGVDTSFQYTRIFGDTTISSEKYFKLTNIDAFGAGSYYRCTPTVHKQLTNLVSGLLSDINIDSIINSFLPPGTPSIPPITIPSSIITRPLKLDANAGDIWNDTIVTFTINPLLPKAALLIENKMLQKNITHNVLGVNYNNTIQVENSIKLAFPLISLPSLGFTTTTYYAKDFGIIQQKIVSMGEVILSRKLVSFRK